MDYFPIGTENTMLACHFPNWISLMAVYYLLIVSGALISYPPGIWDISEFSI